MSVADFPEYSVKETKYATYRERGDDQGIEIRAQNTLIELAAFSRGAA